MATAANEFYNRSKPNSLANFSKRNEVQRTNISREKSILVGQGKTVEIYVANPRWPPCKQTEVVSTNGARRLGRSPSFSMGFFFLDRQKARLSFKSNFKSSRARLQKLWGKSLENKGGFLREFDPPSKLIVRDQISV